MEDQAVLRLIGQYLTEHKYTVTLSALEKERYATRLSDCTLDMHSGVLVSWFFWFFWYLQWKKVYWWEH